MPVDKTCLSSLDNLSQEGTLCGQEIQLQITQSRRDEGGTRDYLDFQIYLEEFR